MSHHIKRADDRISVAQCLPVLLQLRPHYQNEQEQLILQIQSQQQEGFELHYLEHDGQVLACAGIRFLTLLAYGGKVMYVDDLVTDSQCRSSGHAKALMDYLIDYAKSHQCVAITLDSGVQRFSAHRFYLRERFEIMSHHFVRRL